jgi:hypothetical protein
MQYLKVKAIKVRLGFLLPFFLVAALWTNFEVAKANPLVMGGLIPVSIHASIRADYSKDPLQLSFAPIDEAIIAEIRADQLNEIVPAEEQPTGEDGTTPTVGEVTPSAGASSPAPGSTATPEGAASATPAAASATPLLGLPTIALPTLGLPTIALPTLPVPTVPVIQTVAPIVQTVVAPINTLVPTLLPIVPTLAPIIPTLVPVVPTVLAPINTLVPCVPIPLLNNC